MENDCLSWIGGMIVGAIIAYSTFYEYDSKRREYYRIPKDSRPNCMISYDVTKDGLLDIITTNGKVFVNQNNGSYLLLEDIVNQIGSLVKDPNDGRYYTKVIIGEPNAP